MAISFGGSELIQSGNGLADSADDVTGWLTCTDSLKLTPLSVAPNRIVWNIPPYTGGSTSCYLDVTVGTTSSRFSLSYGGTKTVGISAALTTGNTYTITRLNQTSLAFDKVDFVLLDSQDRLTSSIYPMAISATTASGATVTASYLPVGKFAVRAHKALYGYAVGSASTLVTVTTSWAADPTASAVTSSYAGGK